MIIILREPLNSNDTLVSHSFTELNMFVRCSVWRELAHAIINTIHIIYFFADYIKSLMNTLVHRKENV